MTGTNLAGGTPAPEQASAPRPSRTPALGARQVELVKRVRFIVALARSLHRYGTPAPRLENAVLGVADTIGLACNIACSPTSLVFSFREQGGPETVLNEITRVVRLDPGSIDLRRLTLADAVVEQVLSGKLDVDAGYMRLLEIEAMPGVDRRLVVLAFALAGAAVSVLLTRGWAEVAAATGIGMLVGLIVQLIAHRPNMSAATEAVCALVATTLACAISTFVHPISVQTVALASLIVLLPGLGLTTAINELATQHLVSGAARLAGSFAGLLKLTFGVVAGTQLAHLLGWTVTTSAVDPVPDWALWPALLAAGFGFAITFGAARRDFPLVMAAAIAGYLITRYFGTAVGNGAGVFVAALIACASGNLYARIFRRPGALIRMPGIILLVPGSVGFRGLTQAFERDILLSLDTGFTLLSILISLVAGLLFGNLLVPPRRSL
jgi:uncharacterized membrane protein YjjP (DUF1212 family)